MKSLLILMIASFSLLCCSKEQSKNEASPQSLASDTLKLGTSFKGWELYSWPEGENWNYSILVGTNRGKYLNEVLDSKIKVVGANSLKTLLAKLPAGEYLFWSKRVGGDKSHKLSFPEQTVVNDIKTYCESRGIKIYVSN